MKLQTAEPERPRGTVGGFGTLHRVEHREWVDRSLSHVIASAVAERLDPNGLSPFISRQHGGADPREIGQFETFDVSYRATKIRACGKTWSPTVAALLRHSSR